jgi:hypothetical protein
VQQWANESWVSWWLILLLYECVNVYPFSISYNIDCSYGCRQFKPVKHCVMRAQTPMSIDFEHHAIHNNWYKSLVNSGVWSMPINESGLYMFLDIPSCRGDQEENSSENNVKLWHGIWLHAPSWAKDGGYQNVPNHPTHYTHLLHSNRLPWLEY